MHKSVHTSIRLNAIILPGTIAMTTTRTVTMMTTMIKTMMMTIMMMTMMTKDDNGSD